MTKLTDIAKTFAKESQPPSSSSNTIEVNESLGQAAFYYEKLRNLLDWQDEHLFLKNAIKRIVKRRVYLGINQSNTARILLKELVWAKYFSNESIPVSYIDEVAAILRKYNYLRKNVRSKLNAPAITEIVLGLAACEIEEFLRPSAAKIEFTKFIADTLLDKNSDQTDPQLRQKVYLSILRELFKADLDQLRYFLVASDFPNWPRVTKAQVENFGSNFDSVINRADKVIFEKSTLTTSQAVRRQIPPFRIIWEIIKHKNQKGIFENKDLLENTAVEIIKQKNRNIYSRVLRSLIRGIIFVFLTKIIFALIIEYPYELRYFGSVNYTALLINIVLPPSVMMITGFFIRIPREKNTRLLIEQVRQIATGNYQGKIFIKPTRHSRLYIFFNTFYILSSLAILALVVWGLVAIGFNIVSTILFFFFISLVSFLGVRISTIAKELETKASDDTLLTGIFNFVFLPFVYIGKFLSDKWSNYNITLWFWDFIVEAPFKTIISIFESWLAFIREKRQNFE